MLACERSGLGIGEHYISEIDKYANQVTMKHYPDSIQLGNVNKWREWKLPKIDLMIWGSPCQDLSIASKTREGLDGARSGLFWDALEIWKQVRPKYWIMENVASMSKEARAMISWQLGVEPIMINSALVSAQQRKRLYWSNIQVEQPEDKGILLKNILEYGVCEKDKSYCIDACYYYKGTNIDQYLEKNRRQIVFQPIRIGDIGSKAQAHRVYSVEGKSVSLSANGGG